MAYLVDMPFVLIGNAVALNSSSIQPQEPQDLSMRYSLTGLKDPCVEVAATMEMIME